MPEDDKAANNRRSLSQKSAVQSLTSDRSGHLSRLSVQTSMTSQLTDVSNTSFNELVTINEEGHPYIDINRLIFRPTKHHHHHHGDDDTHKKEKLSWYIPDFSFIVFNLMSLCVSTYFCLIGTSTLTWKASIGMFSIPSCWELYNGTSYVSPEREKNFYYLPCKRFTVDAGSDFSPSKGYNFYSPNSFPILRTKLTDVHYFGLVLICIELVNVINVVVGINACLQGYKAILIQHIAVDGLLVLGEFIISAVVAFTSVCDDRDLQAIREILKNFVHWYGIVIEAVEDESDKEKLINAELDALQTGLGCCGVDGWADYLAARYPENDWYQVRTQLDESELVIPYSCCRAWWIRNIYCSHGVHLWAHPLADDETANKFQERIVQEGCMYKLEKLCLNLRSWMGHFGFFVTLVHLIFIVIEAIAALVLIRNINNLIREKKKLMRRKEMLHDEDGSELDFSAGRTSVSSGKKSQWSKVPPPTEDEIMMIKQRSNFNTFMSRVKGGYVGKWMTEAQTLVTEGHELKDEQITAEERKQREKELLHGKAKQGIRDQEVVGRDKEDKGKRAGKGKRGKPQDSKKERKVKKVEKLEPVADPEMAPEPAVHRSFDNTNEAEGPTETKGSFRKTAAAIASIAKLKEHKKPKTKVMWKKKKPEPAKEEPPVVEEEPPVVEEEPPPEPVIEEPPPLTDEDASQPEPSYFTPEDEDQGEHKKKKKRKRRRRMKTRRGDRPPWFQTW